MEALGLSTRHGNDSVTVAVTGELDIATTPGLHRYMTRLLAQGHRQIVIDCSGLEFIGAAGLGTLVAIQNLAQRQGTNVLMAGASPMLRDLLAITQLERHFTLSPP